MDPGDRQPDFAGVVDSVMNLFGQIMTREAVITIVEHYNGDVDQSIDAIMIMSENPAIDSQQSPSSQPVQSAHNTSVINQHETQASPRDEAAPTTIIPVSYAGVSQRTCPKRPLNPNAPGYNQTNTNVQNNIWTLQTKQIVGYHTEGSRTLILLRGVPGSGKSYLAKQLLLTMCPDSLFQTHILSTDDFFYDAKGVYNYDRSRLPEAHYWNQNRAIQALRQGISPIFIDNTNIEIWEMQPYVKEGVNNGYIIEVLEPNTAWAKKANQLAAKNTHNVPIGSIRRMLDNYQNGVSGLYLMRAFKLSYSPEKKPPMLRNFPPILPINSAMIPLQQERSVPPAAMQDNTVVMSTVAIHSAAETTVGQTIDATSPGSSSPENSSPDCENLITLGSDDNENSAENPDSKHDTAVEELAKQIEEIEHAWDNGESWDVDGEENARCVSPEKPCVPQPPRSNKSTVQAHKFLPSTANYNDWSNISMFMPAWNDYQSKNSQSLPVIKAETASKGTSVEYGDTDTNIKNFKILIGTPKDINFYYMDKSEEKIPEKRMLDKSSMTNDHDHIATETSRCKNEEKHFAAFRKLFKNISKVELRDIFDKCVGDVNWAVDIVLDGMANKQLQILDSGDISDSDDFGDNQCECLAAYNIIPNRNAQEVANMSTPQPDPEPIAGPSTPRVKKEKVFPVLSVQLKRQIEKNVVISDHHYSNHCLKIRKMRRGEIENYTRADSPEETGESSSAGPNTTIDAVTETGESSSTGPNTTIDAVTETGESSSAVPNTTIDAVTETASINTRIHEDDGSVSDEQERTVNVDLGSTFVKALDGMFGRNDMQYPENIETKVNMPYSLLVEINALWIESLMDQFDQQSRQSELMLRQDEEFARLLAAKEEELARAGKEPAIPNFHQLMDMELALSIYEKQVSSEWRSQQPNDWAAKMSRAKLHNLFPDVNPDILSEILLAHDNKFHQTVEALLGSTGKGNILVEKDGVKKFIAEKELERQKQKIAEQKKALTEGDWPLLPKYKKVTKEVVDGLREKAGAHLQNWNKCNQRAKSYCQQNMTQVAAYYSDVAALHKQYYDNISNLAASSLIQLSSEVHPEHFIIDLHFQHVPAAMEALDLFIDAHIEKLRTMKGEKLLIPYRLQIITGRGAHSQGGEARIRPAAEKRLYARRIVSYFANPGLLVAIVYADTLMTCELT